MTEKDEAKQAEADAKAAQKSSDAREHVTEVASKAEAEEHQANTPKENAIPGASLGGSTNSPTGVGADVSDPSKKDPDFAKREKKAEKDAANDNIRADQQRSEKNASSADADTKAAQKMWDEREKVTAKAAKAEAKLHEANAKSGDQPVPGQSLAGASFSPPTTTAFEQHSGVNYDTLKDSELEKIADKRNVAKAGGPDAIRTRLRQQDDGIADPRISSDYDPEGFSKLKVVDEDDQFTYVEVPDDIHSYEEFAARFGGDFRVLAGANGVSNSRYEIAPGSTIRVEKTGVREQREEVKTLTKEQVKKLNAKLDRERGFINV